MNILALIYQIICLGDYKKTNTRQSGRYYGLYEMTSTKIEHLYEKLISTMSKKIIRDKQLFINPLDQKLIENKILPQKTIPKLKNVLIKIEDSVLIDNQVETTTEICDDNKFLPNDKKDTEFFIFCDKTIQICQNDHLNVESQDSRIFCQKVCDFIQFVLVILIIFFVFVGLVLIFYYKINENRKSKYLN